MAWTDIGIPHSEYRNRKKTKVFSNSAEISNRTWCFFWEVCMPVDSITGSDGARLEQVRTERRSDEVHTEERRRDDARDREVAQSRQVNEPGRGANMDVTA